MPSNIESEISRVLQAHLQAGIDPAPGKIDEYMQYISDDFTGIGTGPDELMRSRETLHAMIVKERDQMSTPFGLKCLRCSCGSCGPVWYWLRVNFG